MEKKYENTIFMLIKNLIEERIELFMLSLLIYIMCRKYFELTDNENA